MSPKAISFGRVGSLKSITADPPREYALTSRYRSRAGTGMPRCEEQYVSRFGLSGSRLSPLVGRGLRYSDSRSPPLAVKKNMLPVSNALTSVPPWPFFIVTVGQPSPKD